MSTVPLCLFISKLLDNDKSFKDKGQNMLNRSGILPVKHDLFLMCFTALKTNSYSELRVSLNQGGSKES